MDKTIRRVTNPAEQAIEIYRYWQSRSLGERLVAACELSELAFSFAKAFRNAGRHDDQGM